jgi:hypothetical protein
MIKKIAKKISILMKMKDIKNHLTKTHSIFKKSINKDIILNLNKKLNI